MTMKARRIGTPLSSAAPAYRFALAYVPPLVAGMVLTPVFATMGLMARLPGCWLLLYGTAVATGGAFSVRVVPLMGVCFMALGASRSRRPPRGDTGSWPPASAAFTSGSVWSLRGNTVAKALRKLAVRSQKSEVEVRKAKVEKRSPLELDRLIHERLRLGIISALAVNERLTFNDLKRLLQTTDGNLSVHARKLEDAQYIALREDASRSACRAPSTA